MCAHTRTQKMPVIDRSSKRWLPGRGRVCQNFDRGREERSGWADEPRTYAKEVSIGARSGNVHLHTVVWLENLCIIRMAEHQAFDE